MARRKLKPIHLLHPHRADCWMFNGENRFGPWCCPSIGRVDLRRHKTRPVGYAGGTDVLLFRCNDPNCGAQLAVREEYVHEAIGLTSHAARKLGAPKPPKKSRAAVAQEKEQ